MISIAKEVPLSGPRDILPTPHHPLDKSQPVIEATSMFLGAAPTVMWQ